MTQGVAEGSSPVRRPFRFIASMPTIEQPPTRWRDAVRRLEATGFASVAISDHLTRGWAMDPLVTMMAAADASDRMRVLSLVLSNDYRHPALVYKSIATIDVLSGGRAELGLGAGWLAGDYDVDRVAIRPTRCAYRAARGVRSTGQASVRRGGSRLLRRGLLPAQRVRESPEASAASSSRRS